ncbi:MAG: hypothetical protein ABFS02_07560 [Pseudomonadota bacterium]
MFDEINSLILRHPGMLETLRIFFYLKLWSLTGIAMFFVYLIYSEQAKINQKNRRSQEPTPYFFLA